jgi:hypothetical protein
VIANLNSEPRLFLTDQQATFALRAINALALIGLLGVLTGSLALQFWVGEQPCPLCLVQRSAMIGLAVGPIMNLLWGMRPMHYGLSILAAFVGGAGSVRQILLHIADPADPGYGPAFLGFHLYTWAFITFAVGVVGIAVLLLWDRQFTVNDHGLMAERTWQRAIAFGIITWFIIYLLIIGLSVLPECGLGMCPDDPPNADPFSTGLSVAGLLGVLGVSAALGYVANRYLPERKPHQ